MKSAGAKTSAEGAGNSGDSAQRDAAVARERKRARERMRYVEPRNCGKILAHHRYWTVQFLDLYMERCLLTSVESPADAYQLVQQLPELARRIRVSDEAGEHESALKKANDIVRALAVTARCCLAQGEIREAELQIERARKLLGQHDVAPSARAELYRVRAMRRHRLGEPDEALDLIGKALAISEDLECAQSHAEGLLVRADIQRHETLGAAVLDWLEAARLADGKTPHARLTLDIALRQVPAALYVDTFRVQDRQRALRAAQRLQEAFKGRQVSLHKLLILWIAGSLCGGLGIDRHAERQLEKARSGFASLGAAGHYCLASVELMRVLLMGSERDKAVAVARATVVRLESMESDGSLVERVRELVVDDASLMELGRWLSGRVAIEKGTRN